MRPTSAGLPLLDRTRTTLRSAQGAFDLPSIITGVVIVGILTAGVLASIFGVIPFAQDNGAKQDLSALRTAEGVAMVKDGRFMNTAELIAAGYVSGPPAASAAGASGDGFDRVASVTGNLSYAVATDAKGTCYVAVSRSGSSKLFWSSSVKTSPEEIATAPDTGCIDEAKLADVIAGIGGSTDAASPSPGTDLPSGVAPAKPATVRSTGADAAGVDFAWDAVDGAAGYAVQTRSNSGAWTVVTDSQTARTTRVPARTGDVVQLRVAAVKDGAASGYTESPAITAPAADAGVASNLAGLSTWGLNAYGNLGTGDKISADVPVSVVSSGALAGKTITALSAGTYTSCAIADGKAYCWGSTPGDGTGAASTVPVPVYADGYLKDKTVTAIAAAGNCLIADGKGYCWGGGSSGGLGTNVIPNGQSSNVPVPVASSGTMTEISNGGSSTCAIVDGTAYCWGYGGSTTMIGAGYPLGNGSHNTAFTPVKVGGLPTGVTGLNLGFGNGCVTKDGQAYCWGENNNGELGTGTKATMSYATPINAAGELYGKNVTQVVAGSGQGCALADGDVYCWGDAASGWGPNPGTTYVPKKIPALSGKGVTSIDIGSGNTCAKASDGLYCWGTETWGELGNGKAGATYVPVKVLEGPILSFSKSIYNVLALRPAAG